MHGKLTFKDFRARNKPCLCTVARFPQEKIGEGLSDFSRGGRAAVHKLDSRSKLCYSKPSVLT